MSIPLISVIVVTRNRPDDLAYTLESLEQQNLSPAEFEVIVIDNDPSDDTKAVALSPRNLQSLVYKPEPAVGLPCARNTGIGASHGEIIAFIDDDAVATPDWLAELDNAFQDQAVQCVGGRVDGKWLCARPSWFHPDLDPLLSVLDLGNQPGAFDPPSNYPVGTNIAFRRDVFDRYGLFNTTIGRGGSLFSGGEEVELFCKLNSDGGKSLYWPRAVVSHKISAGRLAPERLFRIAFDCGRLAAHLKQKKHASTTRLPTARDRNTPLSANLFRAAIKGTIASGYVWQSVHGLMPKEEPRHRPIPIE